jgi:hypothetical protein
LEVRGWGVDFTGNDILVAVHVRSHYGIMALAVTLFYSGMTMGSYANQQDGI